MKPLTRRMFISAASSAAALTLLSRPGADARIPAGTPFGLMLNEDGDISYLGADVSECEAEVRRIVATLERTPVKTLMYSLGASSDVLYYPTRVASTFGWRRTRLDRAPKWAIRVERGREAARMGLDPVRAAGEQAKSSGLWFIPSYRMNDPHFVADPDHYPLTGEFWLANRHLRIGRSPVAGWDYSNLLDFAHEAVRSYRLAIIREALGRYADIMDGFELDFNRFQIFFAPGEVTSHASLLTDFVIQVRRWLDDLGAERKRRYVLIARVPPSLRNCSWSGLEVADWIGRRLIDVVIPSQYLTLAQDVPVDEFAAIARPANVKVCPAIHNWTHWRSVYDKPPEDWKFLGDSIPVRELGRLTRQATPALIAGAAANFVANGADGFQLYNFDLPFRDEHSLVAKMLADPAHICSHPRIYAVAHCHFNDAEDTFQYRKPLPLTVKTGQIASVTLLTGEDIGTLSHVTIVLRLGFQWLPGDATLELRVNQRVIADGPVSKWAHVTSERSRQDTADLYLHFPISALGVFRRGPNTIAILVNAGRGGEVNGVLRECQLGIAPDLTSQRASGSGVVSQR